MIDFHTHPLLVREMHDRHPNLARIARDVYHIGNNPQPLETFHLELDVSGLGRAVILPIDCERVRGCSIYTNDHIAELCGMSDRFIGFCSVDPAKESAPEELERAVRDLGLRGLKLSPPLQEFYPNIEKGVLPVLEKARELGIPVLFHCGMTWAPKAKGKYGHPICLEDIAHDFEDLNIVMAHFAWPWVLDAVALALKYSNVYIDTSCLYFGNPKEFIRFVMTQQVPLGVIEKNLRRQVVFGSNYPRVEIKNMAAAVREVGLSDETLELVFDVNARRLLGEVE